MDNRTEEDIKLICKCHNKEWSTIKSLKAHIYNYNYKLGNIIPNKKVMDINEAIKMAEEGKIVKEIANYFGVTSTAVHSKFKKVGYKIKKKIIPLIPVVCFHCDRVFKNKYLLNSHLWYYKKRQKEQEIQEQKRTQKIKEIVNDYNQGMNILQVAKKWGVSNQTIYDLFKKLNKELRPYIKQSKEEILAKDRKKYAENNVFKQKCLIGRKKYGETHREEIANYMKEWGGTPKGRLSNKASSNKRRIILECCSEITTEKLQILYEKNIKYFNTLTCELCFEPIKFKEDSLDHFIPISRHDEFLNIDLNNIKNLGVAHLLCNKRKSDKTLEEWFQMHPEYLIKGINLKYIGLKNKETINV
jgi:transposase